MKYILSTLRQFSSALSLRWAILLMVLFSLSMAHAQNSAGGSIYGRVTDASGAALNGVQVNAHSPHIGGAFSAVTNEAGEYRLRELPPGEGYTVSIAQSGFEGFLRTGLVVRAGLNITLDVQLRVGAQSETIEVSGEAPLLETQSAEQNVNLSGDLLRELPLSVRHDWSDSLQVTPGIISASSDAYGGQTYFLRGSENENHATLLDGIDIGSFQQNWPSNTISIGNEGLGDIQIKTGANDASSPAAMGMVINLASPTGSDQLHGTAYYLYGPDALNSANVSGGASAVEKTNQPEFSLGGPIIKKRAWFFVSGRYIDRDDGISRTSTQLIQLKAFDSSFQPFANQSRGFVFLGNITAQLGAKHRLTALLQDDSRRQGGNFQYYAGNFVYNTYGGQAYGLKLTSQWTPRLATRLIASYNNKGTNPTVASAGGIGSKPELDIYTSSTLSSGKQVGQGSVLATLNNLSSISLSPAYKSTFGGDVTYQIPKFFGTHEVGVGFYLEPNERLKSTTIYANNGTEILDEAALNNASDPTQGYTVFHKQAVSAASNLSSYISANDYAWYVQDHWRPTERLSITGGLRADWVSGYDKIFHVSTEHAWNYAPRVGVSYSLTKNNRNVVRASWTKLTDITNASYIGTGGSSTLTVTDQYLVNGAWTTFTTPGATALNTGKVFDPNRHQGYAREWIFGYRKQLPGAVVVDASFIDREYRDRPAQYDTNQIYTTTSSGTVWSGITNLSTNNIYYVTNNKWNWFVYQGYEVTASKQTNKLKLFGTYTFSPNHLAGTWQPNDPAAIIEPTKFANCGGLGSVRGNVTNDYTGDTRNRMWQRNQLRTGFSWRAPYKIHVSSSFTAQSGTPGGPVITTTTYNNQYGPSTLKVTYNGVSRTVSNPLATTYRFAYQDRGTGQIYCPWLYQWDGVAGRNFRFTDRQSVEVDLNIYNIVNGGAAQQFLNGNNSASSTFGTLQNVQLPRSAQFSLRYTF